VVDSSRHIKGGPQYPPVQHVCCILQPKDAARRFKPCLSTVESIHWNQVAVGADEISISFKFLICTLLGSSRTP
jgi:hypothetical protein